MWHTGIPPGRARSTTADATCLDWLKRSAANLAVTDGLLRRCARLRREGPGGVLVKIEKPGQERRADRPTIGPRTIALAAAAGLCGIAVEAGTIILDRDKVAAAADRAGLFIVGVRHK